MDTDSEEGVDGTIVGSLIRILDANSAIAKAFQMARDWCHADATANVKLRLLSERTRSKQYNSSIVVEVAALITNDFGDGEPIRDIVVCKKGSPPKRISELHPSYIALQYPLLFLFGEDGYHEKILYHTNKGKRKTTRDYVTMKEYYTYVIQYRKDQRTTLHRGGRTEGPQSSKSRDKVFKLKLTELLDDLPKNHVFGATGVELPSLTDDPAGYKAVSDYMLHGPCGRIIDPQHKEGINVAMFTDWFDLNERHLPARTPTYTKIPEHYVWHEQEKSRGIASLLLPSGRTAHSSDGKVPTRIKDRKDEPKWIEIPKTFLTPSSELPIQ
nr:hypothetical protein CTI12_AA123990 [Tanacetum cinerariifolium]